jgi:AcrR family transcriptional regulator
MARKQQKTAKTPEKTTRDRIIDGALALAAVQGWESCSVRDIATEADVSLEEFYEHFDDRGDVISAYGRRLDRIVLAQFAELDYETSPRDRLFDILMERFDAASPHREGIVSILRSCKLDPKQAIISLPHVGGSMARMLEAAGLDTAGLRGAARVAGLAALYMWVLRIWVEDESEDLSKTMAALDKGLGRLESAANSLGL